MGEDLQKSGGNGHVAFFSRALRTHMPDNLPFHHVHDELADVRSMVGDPFKILADER